MYWFKDEEIRWIKILSLRIRCSCFFLSWSMMVLGFYCSKLDWRGKRKKIWLDSSSSSSAFQWFYQRFISYSFNSVMCECVNKLPERHCILTHSHAYEIFVRCLLSGLEVQMEREREKTWDFITIEKISLFTSRQRRRRICHHVWVHFLAWTASLRSPWRENEHECEKEKKEKR